MAHWTPGSQPQGLASYNKFKHGIEVTSNMLSFCAHCGLKIMVRWTVRLQDPNPRLRSRPWIQTRDFVANYVLIARCGLKINGPLDSRIPENIHCREFKHGFHIICCLFLLTVDFQVSVPNWTWGPKDLILPVIQHYSKSKHWFHQICLFFARCWFYHMAHWAPGSWDLFTPWTSCAWIQRTPNPQIKITHTNIKTLEWLQTQLKQGRFARTEDCLWLAFGPPREGAKLESMRSVSAKVGRASFKETVASAFRWSRPANARAGQWASRRNAVELV